MIRVAAPTVPIVSMDELKEHVRVDGDEDKAILQVYLDAATAWVDGFDGVLGRCVMEQTWRGDADCLPPIDMQSETVNADGTRDFICAMPAEKVPVVKAAILLLVAYWYDQRLATTDKSWSEAPLAVRSLLSSLRVW